MNIQPGKTYLTRSGDKITVEAETDWSGAYRFRCATEKGEITYRSAKGRFAHNYRPNPLDLVAEA